MKDNILYALSPGDVTVQIVPDWLLENSNNGSIMIPDPEIGYAIPLNKFYIDTISNEFCGIMEVRSVFVNTNIHKDLLEDLYKNFSKFSIYIRQKYTSGCPKILKILENCRFYRQEFAIPQFGMSLFAKYYFSNSSDPWEISPEKLAELTPVNQYIYDYAVSKAIKDFNKDLTSNLAESQQCLRKLFEFMSATQETQEV